MVFREISRKMGKRNGRYIEKDFNGREEFMKQFRLVLTGGPGGGKSVALKTLQERLTKNGIRVIAVPETATELILAGLSPRGILENKDFQALQLDIQLKREDLYSAFSKYLKDEVIILLCDRGALDGKGFIEKDVFDQILKERNLTEENLFQRYNAIFHLTSAAKKDPSLYSITTNLARKETPSQAALEDDQLIDVWKNHPYHIIIPPCQTIEEKIELLEQAILQFLHQNLEITKEKREHS